MSRFDDEYQDDDARDDDEDEGGVGGSTSRNLFSPGGASVRGAGINPPRPASTEGGGSTPQPFPRTPLTSTGSGSPPPARPQSPLNRPGAPAGARPFNPDDDEDEKKEAPKSVQRPSPFAASSGRPDEKRDSQPAPARPSVFGNPRPDEKKDDAPARPSLGAPGKLDTPAGRSPGSGGGAKPDDKSAAKPSGGGFGGFGGGRDEKKDDKSAAKKDDKPGDKPAGGGIGGALSGITSRLPIGGNKDEKKDDKSAAKKDDKPGDKPAGGGIGGALSGITSRFSPGANKEEKKDDKSAAKKDDKPGDKPAGGSIGGALGGITSRFSPGGNKDEKKDDKPAVGGGSPAAQSAQKPAPGGAAPGSAGAGAVPKAEAKKDDKPAGGGFLGRSLGVGGGGQKKDDKSTAKAGAKTKSAAPTFMDQIRALNPFASAAKDKSKPKTAKGVKVEQDGLTLDNKLDILGIVMVISALVMLLSSLSPTKGAITETINNALSYAFGWGAVVVAVVVLAVGVWLLARHFGDEAPTVSRTRLVGFILLFVGGLTVAQFVDALNYQVGGGQDLLVTLRTVFLPIAYTMGRGGGFVGGEVYYLLLSNFGEVGGFLIAILMGIIGVMLSLNLTVADMAVIVLSNLRNLRDANRRRAQRVAAHRMERQEALAKAAAAAAAAAALNPPKQEPLPAPVQPALPMPQPALAAGVPEEQRSISISTGGRTSTMTFPAGGEAVPVPLQPTPAAGSPAPAAAPAKRGGLFGGLPKIGGGKDKDKAVPAQPAPAPAQQPAHPGVIGAAAAGLAGAAAVMAAGADKPAPPAPIVQPPVPVNPATPTYYSAKPAAQPAQPVQPVQPMQAAAPVQPPAAPAVDPFAGAADVQPASPPRLQPQPFQRTPLTEAPRTEPPVDRESLPSFKGTSDLYAPGNPARPPTPAADAPAQPAASAAPAPAATPGTSVPAAPPSVRAAFSADVSAIAQAPTRRVTKEWKMPDTASLLASGDDQEVDHELLLRRARIIEETLSSFGAPGRVVDVRTGPVVTQFGVEPDYIEVRGGKKNRVKVGAIAALDKDLQLALGARSVRIEAPVPGKGYVGIEVPNEKAEVVRLRDVLESEQFKKTRGKSPLGIALGQGVDGTPVAGDLTSMPHLLIAGTTGSGKSVCVNAIITSLLLNNTPRQLKFIMVDPKRVELTQYNGVPHLIAPVVVELERIVSVLKWVTREMDERYRRFSQAAARNIEDYNRHVPASEEPMPYIVVIIDELADLMMLAPDETERVITRIAALARATGIHLVIATQRPSVDVVTGLIKANFPARIAFAVAGSVDSRVILDQPGAERLLGRGDMLYVSGDAPAPQRLQGVYVSDQEIGNITRFWRSQVTDEEMIAMSRPLGSALSSDDESRGSASGGAGAGTAIFSRSASGASSSSVMPWEKDNAARTARARSERADQDDDDIADDDMSDDDGDDVGDELYEQAVEMVRRLNRASVSLLQRRLRIGYTRAARLIDMMEERGVVGPAVEGSRPRDVIMNP